MWRTVRKNARKVTKIKFCKMAFPQLLCGSDGFLLLTKKSVIKSAENMCPSWIVIYKSICPSHIQNEN